MRLSRTIVTLPDGRLGKGNGSSTEAFYIFWLRFSQVFLGVCIILVLQCCSSLELLFKPREAVRLMEHGTPYATSMHLAKLSSLQVLCACGDRKNGEEIYIDRPRCQQLRKINDQN